MRTALALLILGLTASSVMSACTGDNALAGQYGLTSLSADTAASVQVTAAMSVCGWAVGDPNVCCTETQVTTTIKTYLTTLKTTLGTAAGARDNYIIDQRSDVVEVLDSLRKLNEIADSDNADDIPTGFDVVATAFAGFASNIADNFTEIVSNFDDYQTARQTCINALLKTEAAIACASCLATIPTAITAEVSPNSPTVPLDTALLTTLNTACYNYIDYSARQSSIISVAQYKSGLTNLASGLEKAINGDLSGATTDLTAAFTSFGKITNSVTVAEKPVTKPTVAAGCTAAGDCSSWIEDNLFADTGLLTNDNVILGGTEQAISFVVSRALKSEGKERRLAASGFAPDLTKITYDVTFDKNPGNADNTKNANSALRNGIVAVAIAALALVF